MRSTFFSEVGTTRVEVQVAAEQSKSYLGLSSLIVGGKN